jgi:hypothetical protein
MRDFFAGAKPFLCPHCDLRFRTSGQRKAHMSAQHPPTEDTTSAAIPSGLIPLTIPASSMTQALDAVSSAGESLLGATVRLQLQGTGLENAVAQLQVRLVCGDVAVFFKQSCGTLGMEFDPQRKTNCSF